MRKYRLSYISQVGAWLTLVLSTSVYADYDIGGPNSGPLAHITSFIQDFVNWVDGPMALAFSFLSLAALAITWAIAPKMMAAMGVAVRVLIAVVIILNIGVWITAWTS